MPATGVPPLSIGTGITYAFIYTATGVETDLFVMTFPGGALANTNYIAQLTPGKQTAGPYTLSADPSLYTTTGITVRTGIAPTAGDTITVTIEPRTT
jgi:hypothetical protein